MYYHRLIVSYKGTHYFGWQDLGTAQAKSTIEGSIYKVLQKICKYQPCIISAASRTDAGVHAKGQVMKISIPLVIDSDKLVLGMNSLLSEDIRILQCEPCDVKFNPNQDSTSKEYHYYFCRDKIYNPIFNEIIAHVGSVNIEDMQEACKLFIGEHDFYSFAKRDTAMNSTVRTIVSCEILAVKNFTFDNEIYYLKIEGMGFLRYMVRYIAAALFALGKTQLKVSDISEALFKHKEKKLTSRAKAEGLHLIQINY